MTATIHCGDAREVLATLPAGIARTCVTSPPYFGLRDYGVEGQIGLEATVEEYVAELVAVFREVRRVLTDDGTLWLNLGDSYAGSPVGSFNGGGFKDTSAKTGRRDLSGVATSGKVDKVKASGLKPKDLIGIPWRVAFALQADGWYLRQDIVWHKPNPMPESVTDRCTKAHEFLFLLSKRPRYFFDAAAIAEAAVEPAPRWGWEERKARGEPMRRGMEPTAMPISGGVGGDGVTRNRRSVWTVATQPFPGSHFATFPPKLIEPCILAGTSERGQCPACRRPWVRVVEREPATAARVGGVKTNGASPRNDGTGAGGFYDASTRTVGWEPSCACGLDPVPDTVLDPFTGSGTTGLVADRLGRHFVGCELNPEYAEMARRRITNDAPLFATVEVLA